MDVKVPAAAPPQIQPPGQPVVFNVSKMGGGSEGPKISLASHSLTKIIAGVTMLLLVGGVGVGVYLVGQQQQVNSRASNEVPQNISKVVPQEVINPNATLSAQPNPASSSADPASGLEDIVIPELEEDLENSTEVGSQEMYDFNIDGTINALDLSFMYTGWGVPQTEDLSKADLNQDGIINGLDYSLILPYYNQ